MATDLIRYDLLVQDALRGVVRDVLTQAAKNGLQGDHHFFITFRTNAPGLRLSNRMRTRYPEEMTIILQHQFWDLGVTEHAFEVGLSFSNVPERLLVPFAAITSFVDPSVQFGLKFEVQDEPGNGSSPTGEPSNTPEPLKALPGKRALASVESSGSLPKLLSAAPDPVGKGPPVKGKPTLAKAPVKEPEPAMAPASIRPAKPAADKPGSEKAEGQATDQSDPKKVVSIDSFRKKP